MSTTKSEAARTIIKNVYDRSRNVSGDSSINYAYASGAFEVIIESLLREMPQEVFDKAVKHYLDKN